jgi:hypothetical protein
MTDVEKVFCKLWELCRHYDLFVKLVSVVNRNVPLCFHNYGKSCKYNVETVDETLPLATSFLHFIAIGSSQNSLRHH